MATPDMPVVFFTTAKDWRKWLGLHHAKQVAGVWLKFAKKKSGITSIVYDEALDEALCYGWIDGQTKSLDDTYYLQKFTPRRTRSMWSKRNVNKAAELIKQRKMKPAGLAAIEAAKKDGRWEQAYDSPSTIIVPADFETALNKNTKAKAFFKNLTGSNRYAFLYRIQTAKKPETRATRIAKFIAMLEEGKTFH